MCCFAMDLGWKRVPMLLILLIFWKHAFGQKGWSSHYVPPYQKWHDHKIASPRGAQSSVFEIPVTGSIPLEEVASNVLAGKTLNPSRSRFSYSHQFVKGGISGGHASMSRTQSAPSSSVSASLVLPQNLPSLYSNLSLLQLQGSSSPGVQDIAKQSGLQLGETSSPLSAQSSSSTGSSASSLIEFIGSSQPQLAGSSSQLVSTDGVSGLLPQSQDTASQISGSSMNTELAASPLFVSHSTSSSTGLSASSLSNFIGSSQPQLAGSSSQLVSTDGVSGLLPQSQDTASQISGSSMNTELAASPLFVSHSTSSSTGLSASSLSNFIGSSQPQLAGSSGQLVSTDGVSGLLPQSQDTASQISGSSMNTKLGASPLFVSESTSSSTGSSASSLSEFISSSQPQLAGSSSQLVSTDVVSGLLPQSQDTASQISGSSMNTELAASPLFVSHSTSSSTGSSASSLSEFTDASQGSPQPQLAGSSGQLVSTDGVSGFLPQSQDTASQISGSSMNTKLVASPLSISQSTSSSSVSSASSLSEFSDASQGSPQPQLAGSYSQPVSTDGVSGLLPQSQSTASQISGSSMNTKLAASPLSVSQSTSGQSSYSQYTSGSQRTVGTKLVASNQYVPNLESSYGSSFQPQGASSQYAPNLSQYAPVPVPSQYHPATLSGSSQSLSQSSQKWQPSTSRTKVFQPSRPAVFQGFQTSGASQSVSQYPSRFVSQSNTPSQSSKSPSRFSTLTSAASPGQSFSNVYTSSSPSRAGAQLAGSSHVPMQTGSTSDGSSLQLQGSSSQYAPALVAKDPPYQPAAPSGSSSLSQLSQWQPSTSRFPQAFQASGSVASQSGSLAQGSKSPSRFSTLTSAASPGQSFSNVYTSSSLSGAGAQLAGSSRYVPMQTGSTSTDGSSLQFQGSSSQYAPALVAKDPLYKPAAPSGSSSLSQQSQWQPSTSRLPQAFQASGSVASQSGSLAQGSKSPSRFSTLTSAASPGQSFSNVYTSSSPSRAGAQLAGSSHVPMQTGSTSDGSSLQLQGSSSQYAPALVAKDPPYQPAAPSGSLSLIQQSQWQPSTSRLPQAFQASGSVASQSGFLAQGSKSPSRFSTLTSAASPGQSFSNVYTSSSPSRAGAQLAGSSRYVPMQTGSTSTDGSSLQLQGSSSQYAPAFFVKDPPYKPAAPSGSSSLSQLSQWQPSTSRFPQAFQASGSVASQSGSLAQGSKSPSRFSTLTSAASPGQSFSNVYTSSSPSRAGAQLAGSSRYVPMQTGSTSTDGSSLQFQGSSSQYAPALVAKDPLYKPAAPSGSSSLSQQSQWQPSTSRLPQAFQASGSVASQSGSLAQGSKSPSRFSTLTSAASPGQSFSNVYTSSSPSRGGAQLAGSSHVPMQTGSTSDGSSLQLQGSSSQYAPALVAKDPLYKPAAPSGSSSLSQLSQWQPSTSRFPQAFQASGSVASQSGSLAQGSKSPSRFSTPTSAASPGQSFSNVYTSSSPSGAGAQLAGSSRYVPMQTGSTSTDGSSLQLQGSSSQYAPAFSAKDPLYQPAAPSGSSSLSQLSQFQPSTSRLPQAFQASGSVASQSGSLAQGSKSPSRFSTLTSAASPGQSFSNVYTSSSLSGAGAQLAGSRRYVPMQTGSTSTDGSSLQLQGTSSQYATPPLVAQVPPYKQSAPSGSSSLSQLSQLQSPTSRWSQGFQASGTVASQSSFPSQGSKSPSRFSTLTSAASPGQSFSNVFTSSYPSRAGAQLAGSSRYVPMQTGSTSTDGSSPQLQVTSSQYAPALAANVLPYKLAASSGSSSLSQLSQLQPPTSRWSQGFQASGTVASQSSFPSQGSSSPGISSTLTSAASPANFFSTQDGSGRYSSLSSQSQSASSQYNPVDSSTYDQKPSKSSSLRRYYSAVKG